MFEKNIELSPINGLEPASNEKGQMPTSSRLRPKEIFKRDRCASGWLDIYDHSTNPVQDSIWHSSTSVTVPVTQYDTQKCPNVGRFLTKNAVFWLVVARYFQIEACFVFICVLSSHHKVTTPSMNHKWRCDTFSKAVRRVHFRPFFGLICHVILYRTTQTPVIA